MDVPSKYDQTVRTSTDKEVRTLLAHNRFAEFVLFQVDDTRALALLNDPRSPELANSLGHTLLADLALARILVEVDVQTLVLLRVFPDGELAPDTPILQRALIAVLHALEPRRRSFLDSRVILGVLVDGDVDVEQVLNGVFLELFVGTVLLVPDRDQSELHAL